MNNSSENSSVKVEIKDDEKFAGHESPTEYTEIVHKHLITGNDKRKRHSHDGLPDNTGGNDERNAVQSYEDYTVENF